MTANHKGRSEPRNRIRTFAFCALFNLCAAVSQAETIVEETFSKVIQGLGATDTKIFTDAAPDAGVYSCNGYAISEEGARGFPSRESVVSNTAVKIFMGDGPHDISLTWQWPTEWSDGQAIVPGEVRTGKIICTRPDPEPEPDPEVRPKPFTNLS